MGERPAPRTGIRSRRRRGQLLVARTAGAVPGAMAGGAVAIGAGMSALPTTTLGVLGALLGAVAATREATMAEPAASRPAGTPEPAGTPPQGIALS